MKTKSFLILALTAGLAGLATPAKASIIYADLNSYQVNGQGAGVVYAAPGNLLTTGLHLTVGFLGIDPDGNGVGFANYFSSEDPDLGILISPAGIYGNTVAMLITSSTVSMGSTVGGTSSFANGGYVYPTVALDEQYIGAAAKSGNDYYYGWVGFTIADGVFTLKEAAFNSTANQSITIETIPEPSALMLGALGAIGLAARRRR